MQQPSPHETPQEWQQQHNNDLQPSDSSPAAAALRQQPTDDAEPEPADTAVLIDSSEQPQAAARQQYTKQVSFPPDDNLATVHQLQPSSSAGDLAPWSEEAAAAGEQEGDCCVVSGSIAETGTMQEYTLLQLHWQQQIHACSGRWWLAAPCTLTHHDAMWLGPD